MRSKDFKKWNKFNNYRIQTTEYPGSIGEHFKSTIVHGEKPFDFIDFQPDIVNYYSTFYRAVKEGKIYCSREWQ